MKLLSVVLVLSVMSVAGETRRVVIYPLTHEYHEFTFWRSGISYTGGDYRAIVVVADQMDKLYSIHCDMMKRWDHCHSLIDNSYWADIGGHKMKIWAQWEGNQHKGYSDTFEIDNIAPLNTPFHSVDDIDAFKKSDAFKKLLAIPQK